MVTPEQRLKAALEAREIAQQAARIARAAELDTLAYILDMAVIEANVAIGPAGGETAT